MNTLDLAIDSVILGDNQFFGVNHMSERRGMETREKFKDIGEIKKMLYIAMDLGVKGVFFSTHPDIYEITNMIRNDPALKNHFNIYVNVPYIVKYISMVNTVGPVATIQTMLQGKNAKFFVEGAKNLLSTDYMGLAMQLVEVEIAPFYDLNVKAVLLHNSLCDLALAYNLTDVMQSFDQYVKKIGVIPGYGTQNYPAFSSFLKRAGLGPSFVMTAINKMGFYMNPDKESYENALVHDDNTILAMASLASGRLKPDEAYEYLASIGLNHILVGLSSKSHAEETFGAIRKYVFGEEQSR